MRGGPRGCCRPRHHPFDDTYLIQRGDEQGNRGQGESRQDHIERPQLPVVREEQDWSQADFSDASAVLSQIEMRVSLDDCLRLRVIRGIPSERVSLPPQG
jgi:hypothetical protein